MLLHIKFFPAATDISRPQRSAESTAAPTTQSTTTGPSPYSGTPFLVLQQGKDGKDGVNGRDGRDGLPGSTGEKGEAGVQGPPGSTGPQGESERLCRNAHKNMFVTQFGALAVNNQVPLVPVWVVWCIPGGGEPNVQTSLEHNLCMLEELLEAISPTREGQLTTYVCLMIRAIYSSDLDLQSKVTYMVLSMRHQVDHSQCLITKMCRVQCATFPPGEQY